MINVELQHFLCQPVLYQIELRSDYLEIWTKLIRLSPRKKGIEPTDVIQTLNH